MSKKVNLKDIVTIEMVGYENGYKFAPTHINRPERIYLHRTEAELNKICQEYHGFSNDDLKHVIEAMIESLIYKGETDILQVAHALARRTDKERIFVTVEIPCAVTENTKYCAVCGNALTGSDIQSCKESGMKDRFTCAGCRSEYLATQELIRKKLDEMKQGEK